MNEGLLDQKTAGVEVSAKLCNGDMAASIPVMIVGHHSSQESPYISKMKEHKKNLIELLRC